MSKSPQYILFIIINVHTTHPENQDKAQTKARLPFHIWGDFGLHIKLLGIYGRCFYAFASREPSRGHWHMIRIKGKPAPSILKLTWNLTEGFLKRKLSGSMLIGRVKRTPFLLEGPPTSFSAPPPPAQRQWVLSCGKRGGCRSLGPRSTCHVLGETFPRSTRNRFVSQRARNFSAGSRRNTKSDTSGF